MSDQKPQKIGISFGDLYGPAGNAWAILGNCTVRLRESGWPSDAIERWRERATTGDYAQLLEMVLDSFWVPKTERQAIRQLITFTKEGRAAKAAIKRAGA